MPDESQPRQGIILDLNGNEEAVGRIQRVDRDQAQRRRAVQEDIVIVGGDRYQGFLQEVLPAYATGKGHLRFRKPTIGRKKVEFVF